MFYDKIEMVEEQLINKKTGEELSLSIIDNRCEEEDFPRRKITWPFGYVIEIKRKRVASNQR